ncbi:potassium-transporting ATPase subunit KdpB [Cupriavidus respiraculi]|uniref:potassium-transporting ATPase subunit KdpB n=1 Tax=Cupriavidus respiraculi TaxID=195930 RepID=UPI001C93CDB3|nr:potassium-transporting ATPase subunit KdpB [Cupriavidus respiraculi]MBY4946400.1 potassium-transporting ATPase subunit KdpB [Cupriavidus respiraculi]
MQQQSLATARGADGVHRTDAAPPPVSSPIPGKAFTAALIRPALVAAVRKLSPRQQLRNPVMFVVYVGSLLTTLLCVRAAWAPAGGESWGFVLAVTVWLWFTVLFANFAEALAEGRSRQQAQALRGLKTTVMAKVLLPGRPAHARATEPRAAAALRRGDVVLVEAGDTIPGDGEVVEGVASVDESAITGESAPVIRESGGDFSSVTGGTRVLSDWIVVRITANPGETFIDRMIAMVEGAKRQKTPNELALTILLVSLTIVLLMATATLRPFSLYSAMVAQAGVPVTVTVLVALLVCLIPTTIGGLLSAIGVAGMSRMMASNVIATSGRAVEAAGDVDVLLLDKTGTITHGNRQAARFIPAPGVDAAKLAEACWLASLADDTPEGRSIVALARQGQAQAAPPAAPTEVDFVAFSAQTRMSGVDLRGSADAAGGMQAVRSLRKGAADAVRGYVAARAGKFPDAVSRAVEEVARAGGTPLVVVESAGTGDGTGADVRVLGVIELKDVVKAGIRERFGELRRMGIRTVMITGDNRLTAASIAAEAGVDDFLAEATPEAKLRLIRQYQAEGRLVAMTGDGTNDAPALAQADVAVAMNSGTQAAREAANMVDLDSNPTKLIEIVEIGKQMLMTRGALTTFSVANDLAKYFAIIPAAFATTYPQLGLLNVMGLATPASAILSAVVFNALIIVALIPLALGGVRYRPLGAAVLLRRNLLVYGLGGIAVPFAGIKAIDMVIAALGWA